MKRFLAVIAMIAVSVLAVGILSQVYAKHLPARVFQVF